MVEICCVNLRRGTATRYHLACPNPQKQVLQLPRRVWSESHAQGGQDDTCVRSTSPQTAREQERPSRFSPIWSSASGTISSSVVCYFSGSRYRYRHICDRMHVAHPF